MKADWDVVVVGAGLGGLTAAAVLAKAGRRVLVLDRHSHPGGTAFLYRRRGFAFPMGPLGFSSPDRVRAVLEDAGVAEIAELRRVHYRVHAPGLDVPISLPAREVRAALSGLFPGDAAGIGRFFGDVESFEPPEAEPGAASVHQTSAAEYVSGLVEDRRLRRLLGSLGTREPTLSRPLLLAAWRLMTEPGIWHPRGGLEVFCERLAAAVEAGAKAEIRLGAEAVRILTRGGAAAGVRLEDGTEIGAAAVVSNADFKTTYLRLLGEDDIPFSLRTDVTRAGLSGSILQVGLGLDPDRADLSAFRTATRIVHRRGDGPEKPGSSGAVDPDAYAAREMEISLWSAEEKGYAPARKAVVVIRADADYRDFAALRLGRRKRADAYAEIKKRLAAALTREAETLIPGLGRAVEAVDVATPLTFEDQGGRWEGATAGWSLDFRERAPCGGRDLVRTPVRGLYMAGGQAFSAPFHGGVPTAMESGRRAARAVLEKADPTDEIRIPAAGGGEDG